MKELNSCPFCESRAVAVCYKEDLGDDLPRAFVRRAFVKCFDCSARGPLVSSYDKPENELKELAADYWNGVLKDAIKIGAPK